MRGHPDGCVCAGCEHNMPFTGYLSDWSPGPSWPHETLPWLAGHKRRPGWLRNQVRRSAAVLNGLPAEMVRQMAHRTNMREDHHGAADRPSRMAVAPGLH